MKIIMVLLQNFPADSPEDLQEVYQFLNVSNCEREPFVIIMPCLLSIDDDDEMLLWYG